MLIIRQEQMKVFEQIALQNFKNDMILHIKQFSPRVFVILGEPVIREIIELGIKHAEKYGFTNRGPVRFYIEMMLMFGSDFDTDPQYPWVHEILNDIEDDQLDRADFLYEKLMDYIENVAGPEYENEKKAINRASQINFEKIEVSDENLDNECLLYAKKIHPQKYKYVGEKTMKLFIKEGKEMALNNSISAPMSVMILIGLRSAFGHGCLTDPQFPWIGATMKNSSIGDVNQRIEQLYLKSMTYLGQGLIRLGKG